MTMLLIKYFGQNILIPIYKKILLESFKKKYVAYFVSGAHTRLPSSLLRKCFKNVCRNRPGDQKRK